MELQCGLDDSDRIQISSLPYPPNIFTRNYSDENVFFERTPKPPPVIDSYSMFGKDFTDNTLMIRSLESQGIKPDYTIHCNRKKKLKEFNIKALLDFLDLIDTLIKDPDNPKRKETLKEINKIFVQMIHILNEMRPHQAREALRLKMELQKRQRMESTKNFKKALGKTCKIIYDACKDLKLVESTDQLLKDTEVSLNYVEEPPIEKTHSFSCSSIDAVMCEIIDKQMGFY